MQAHAFRVHVPVEMTTPVDTHLGDSRLSRLLLQRRREILAASTMAMARTRARHYEELAQETIQQRLELLLARVIDAVRRRDASAICSYARTLAKERFEHGYGLGEVQTAFNVLEEELWHVILRDVEPSHHADALALASSILGAAKDALAMEYVTLAARRHAQALDIERLFEGGGS